MSAHCLPGSEGDIVSEEPKKIEAKFGDTILSVDGARMVTIGYILTQHDEEEPGSYEPVGLTMNTDEAQEYLLEGTVGQETSSILALPRGDVDDA